MFQGDEEFTQLLKLTINGPSVDRDFKEKSVKSLLRRIRDTDGKRNAQNFLRALESRSSETECTMIATPKDGRIQIEKLKYAVEVLSYKLWCNPDLMSRVDLKRNPKCNFHLNADSKYICINPYHLQKVPKNEKESNKRARPSSPRTLPNLNLNEMRLNSNFQLNFDQNYFDDDRNCNQSYKDADYRQELKSPVSQGDSDFYDYSSSHNGSSPTQVNTYDYPKLAAPTPLYQFQHEESENWCSIKYYEYNQLVGTFDVRADQPKVQIDGFSSTNKPHRISLGAISNPFRGEKVRTCQKNIRQGQW